ncbi:MAG: cadherin repeat domain-containing protein, partial [Vampirovibrionales bacterium]
TQSVAGKVLSLASPKDGMLFHVLDEKHYYLKLTGSGLVSEYAKVGTRVGVLHPVGFEDASRLRYTLLDDANGRFALHPTTAVLTVKDGTRIQHANQATHTLLVEVHDPQGETISLSHTLRVTPMYHSEQLRDIMLAPEIPVTATQAPTVSRMSVLPMMAIDGNDKSSFTKGLEPDVNLMTVATSATTWALLQATLNVSSQSQAQYVASPCQTMENSALETGTHASVAYTQQAFVSDTSMFHVDHTPSRYAEQKPHGLLIPQVGVSQEDEQQFLQPQTFTTLYRHVSQYHISTHQESIPMVQGTATPSSDALLFVADSNASTRQSSPWHSPHTLMW